MLIEPRAASTGPGAGVGDLEAHRRDPEAAVLSMHADWWIGGTRRVRRHGAIALRAARTHDRLITVGMVPSRPETGYGYIVPGQHSTETPRTVARFPRNRTRRPRST